MMANILGKLLSVGRWVPNAENTGNKDSQQQQQQLV